jgi:16S rRNA processing protein RimM
LKTSEKLITVGRLGRVYGVQGWLTVHSYTEPRMQLFDYQPWLVGQEGQWQALEVTGVQQNTKHDLVHFAGYDSPEDSRRLTGLWLAIPRERLPKLPPGEYYWDDLVGLEVVTDIGVTLGTVTDVFSTGAHPILNIQGERAHLVPFVQPDIVTDVNLRVGRLVAKWDPDF